MLVMREGVAGTEAERLSNRETETAWANSWIRLQSGRKQDPETIEVQKHTCVSYPCKDQSHRKAKVRLFCLILWKNDIDLSITIPLPGLNCYKSPILPEDKKRVMFDPGPKQDINHLL